MKIICPTCPNCKVEWTRANTCTVYVHGECPHCGRYVEGGALSETMRQATHMADEKPRIPEEGDRVRDTYHNITGTVTGHRSGLSIAVTWDSGHPFTDNPTLALFEDLELVP